MSIGWQSVGGNYYYFNNSGHAVSGWIKDGTKYYYLDPSADGRMVANTSMTIDGTVYTFGADGVCTTTVNVSNVTTADAKAVSGSQSSSTDNGDKKNVIVSGSNR
jgi:glucan-binding YG repeat protein